MQANTGSSIQNISNSYINWSNIWNTDWLKKNYFYVVFHKHKAVAKYFDIRFLEKMYSFVIYAWQYKFLDKK